MINFPGNARLIAFSKGLRKGPCFLAVAAMGIACTYSDVGPVKNLSGFESRLENLRNINHIPGMMAGISRNGQPIWTSAFGYADVENKIPVQPTTLFHLASLTKTYASTILMQLVEDNLVSLDDPVSKFGIQIQAQGTVRVRHLITHTSEGVPGSKYNYNGNRYALLDDVIRVASSSSFQQLLSEKIFTPLALTHTAPCDMHVAASIGLDTDMLTQNLAQGYSDDGKVAIAYPNSFTPAAGLIATVSDVLAYSAALDGNALLSDNIKAEIFSPAISNSGETLPYGLGWFVQYVEGRKIVWHYGLWTGNSSLIIKVPDQGLTFVLLANSSMLSNPYPLGYGDLMKSPFGKEFLKSFVLPGALL